MITHSIKTYGAQYHLTMRSPFPQELAKRVAQYMNNGMMRPAALPDTYKDGEDTAVTFPVTKARLRPALANLFETLLISRHRRKPRNEFCPLAVAGGFFQTEAGKAADALIASFARTADLPAGEKRNASAEARNYQLAPDEDTPELRNARWLLDEVRSGKREMAERRDRVECED